MAREESSGDKLPLASDQCLTLVARPHLIGRESASFGQSFISVALQTAWIRLAGKLVWLCRLIIGFSFCAKKWKSVGIAKKRDFMW